MTAADQRATVDTIEAAIQTLVATRVAAYAIGEEAGAELDYAVQNLNGVVSRIKLGVAGAPMNLNGRA